MRHFRYTRARSMAEALAAVTEGATPIAGGTTLVDLMRAGVEGPRHLVDVSGVAEMRGRDTSGDPARIGALTTMAELAADPAMVRRFPAVAESLRAAASAQIRNVATLGGNLLQRPRCPSFRDPAAPCNRRLPGSGCGALSGPTRDHAVLGASPSCVAAYPGDLPVALVAVGAVVRTVSPRGPRILPVEDLHCPPAVRPDRLTVLAPDELVTGLVIPALPAGAGSAFVKLRDRTSYAFAVASAAVVLGVRDGHVDTARVVLGGVATIPWRSREAEQELVSRPAGAGAAAAAAEAALCGAVDGPRAAAGRAAVVQACRTAAHRAGS